MDGSKLNHQAAETYSKSFSLKIINHFFSENSGITGQQILGVTPIKQVNFFILKALFAQWQEETKKFQSPFFSYKNNEVKTALKQLVNTLSKNIFIEKTAFQPLLEEAVLDTILLLCQANEFYKKEFSSIPGHQFQQGLTGLSKYVKLRKDLFDALANEFTDTAHAKDPMANFDTIIQHLEGQHPSSDSEFNGTLKAFDAILPISFLEQIEDIPEPPDEIRIVENNSESEIPEPSPSLTAESGYEPLDSPVSPPPSNTEEVEAIPNKVEERIETVPNKVEEPIEAFSSNDNLDQEFEPLDSSDTEDDSPAVEIKIEEETSTTLNDQFSEELPTVNDQFEIEIPSSTVAEVHQNKSISNLHGSININQRFMFLNDLFNGDVEQYEHALIEVEMSDSFDDSVEMLVQNYSKKYNWDMNSDEVKELLKVIFKKFR